MEVLLVALILLGFVLFVTVHGQIKRLRKDVETLRAQGAAHARAGTVLHGRIEALRAELEAAGRSGVSAAPGVPEEAVGQAAAADTAPAPAPAPESAP
ncbi:MAG: hypothetical protein ACRENE_31705, partial [Polyangiaceae bacterium]